MVLGDLLRTQAISLMLSFCWTKLARVITRSSG
jgi:hypothetical protein